MSTAYELVFHCPRCGPGQGAIAVDPAALLAFHRANPEIHDLDLHVHPEPDLLIHGPAEDVQEPCRHLVGCWIGAIFRKNPALGEEVFFELNLIWHPRWIDAGGAEKELSRDLWEYASCYPEVNCGVEPFSPHNVVDPGRAFSMQDRSTGENWDVEVSTVFILAEDPRAFIDELQCQLRQLQEDATA